MKNIIEKIKKIRLQKGYSHEFMALELNISQVAYSKIEKNETKLTVERLFKIAEILEVKIDDILDIQPSNQMNKKSSTDYLQNQEIQNLHHDNKEVYEELIALKDEQIALLTSLLEKK